jgi:hypothetical protein
MKIKRSVLFIYLINNWDTTKEKQKNQASGHNKCLVRMDIEGSYDKVSRDQNIK